MYMFYRFWWWLVALRIYILVYNYFAFIPSGVYYLHYIYHKYRVYIWGMTNALDICHQQMDKCIRIAVVGVVTPTTSVADTERAEPPPVSGCKWLLPYLDLPFPRIIYSRSWRRGGCFVVACSVPRVYNSRVSRRCFVFRARSECGRI